MKQKTWQVHSFGKRKVSYQTGSQSDFTLLMEEEVGGGGGVSNLNGSKSVFF